MANAFLTKKRDISKELAALVEATNDLPRGSLVTHDTITELTGFDQQHSHRGSLIGKWKRAIRETRGIEITAAVPYGTGYKLLTVEEQMKHRPERLRASRRRLMNKEAACIGSVAAEELDEHMQAFQEARLHQLADERTSSDKQRALIASWLSNPATLPKVRPTGIQ